MKGQAYIAFQHALSNLDEKYKAYAAISGNNNLDLPWQPKVLTYEEMEGQLIKKHGDPFVEYIKGFKNSLLEEKQLDTRLFTEKSWRKHGSG